MRGSHPGIPTISEILSFSSNQPIYTFTPEQIVQLHALMESADREPGKLSERLRSWNVTTGSPMDSEILFSGVVTCMAYSMAHIVGYIAEDTVITLEGEIPLHHIDGWFFDNDSDRENCFAYIHAKGKHDWRTEGF